MEIIDNIPVWGAPVDDGALRRSRPATTSAAKRP
jgi:hypothetical protein